MWWFSRSARVSGFEENMSRFAIFIIATFILAACAQQPRALLPVSHAPLREEVRDVPPTGVISVRPGDTIYTLANRYQVTPRRIILANSLPPPYDLSRHTSLNVPKPRGHTVGPGDTLEKISARYKVSINDLVRLNALQSPYRIHQGQSIAIPRRLDYSLLDLPEERSSTAAATPVARRGPAQTSATVRTVRYSSGSSDFTWPVDGQIIEPFGTSARGVHNDGVNIAANAGDAVRASQDGEVAFVGSGLKAFGNLVLIKHHNGWITAYAHLGEVTVKEGDAIERGQVLGVVGQTGRVDSPQLHFEVRQSRTPVDPEELLS
jgi:LysM repeat protein